MGKAKINLDKDWLYDQYINKKKTGNQIAKENNITKTTVYRYLDKYNISTRNNRPYKYRYNHNGYCYIKDINHPNCNKNGYVLEHRVNLEEKIGRLLNNDEDSHHIDFDKTNNSKDNLDVIKHKDHHNVLQSLLDLIPMLLEKGIVKYENKRYIL